MRQSSDRAGSGRRVRLRDVLRADISELHGLVTPSGRNASPGARFLLRLLEEHHGAYGMRVLYCPPLPLLRHPRRSAEC